MNNELRPVLRSSIQIIRRGDKYLYLEPAIPDWIVIKSKYNSIMQMMNGEHFLQDIFDYIQNEYSHESKMLEKQVSDFVSTSRLLNSNPILLPDSAVSHIRYVYLTLTDKCNLNCIYCYAKQRVPAEELNVFQWISIIDKFLDLFKDIAFTFTGGEPLLIKDVFKLAEHVSKQQCKAILLTNGQLLANEDYAQKASTLFSEIRISIDSTEEITNSVLRGEKALEKAFLGYQNCQKHGNTPFVMCTVSKLNINQLKNTISVFGDKCVFQPLFKMGNAQYQSDLAITGTEYFNALKDAGASISMSGLYNNIHNYRCNPYKRCALGIEELSVGPDGTLFPCHMMHYDNLSIGNMIKDNINYLHNSSPILEQLRQLNVDTIGQCSNCIVRNFCGMGCRARIGINGIEPQMTDSFCSFEKESIIDALFYSFD